MISFTPSRARRIPGIRPHGPPATIPATIISGIRMIAGRAGRNEREQDDRAGAPGAEQELALGADVPQAHPEGQRAGQAGQDQRRRLDERVGQDADAAERRVQDVE